jgi:hypothetical protein
LSQDKDDINISIGTFGGIFSTPPVLISNQMQPDASRTLQRFWIEAANAAMLLARLNQLQTVVKATIATIATIKPMESVVDSLGPVTSPRQNKTPPLRQKWPIS